MLVKATLDMIYKFNKAQKGLVAHTNLQQFAVAATAERDKTLTLQQLSACVCAADRLRQFRLLLHGKCSFFPTFSLCFFFFIFPTAAAACCTLRKIHFIAVMQQQF